MKKENGIIIKLKRFLKDNGAYSSFRKNFLNKESSFIRTEWIKCSFKKNYTENVPNGELFKAYCKSVPSDECITYAFEWGDTKEGFTFWDDLDKLWRKVI